MASDAFLICCPYSSPIYLHKTFNLKRKKQITKIGCYKPCTSNVCLQEQARHSFSLNLSSELQTYPTPKKVLDSQTSCSRLNSP